MFVYEIRAESVEKMPGLIDALAASGARNIEQGTDGVTAKVESPVAINFAAMGGLESHRQLDEVNDGSANQPAS